MKNKAKTFTREHARKMNVDDYSALREAYYQISDGLYGISEQEEHLGTEEREALAQMKAAFEKLNKLGAIL